MPIEDQFKHLIETLTDDVTGCAELLDSNVSSPVVKRAFVRAILAAIEGHIYWLKQAALTAHNRQVQFSSEEIALLKEEAYELANNGTVSVKKAKLRLINNLKFAFKMMAKAGFTNYTLDMNSKEWNQFLHAVSIRDRLMHPKQSSDFIVTDPELEDVKVASLWFIKKINELVESSCHSMAETLPLLSEAIKFADEWLKLINQGTSQEIWETFSSISKQKQTFEQFEVKVGWIRQTLGSSVFRTLVFKTRLLDESDPAFNLESIALFTIKGEGKILHEKLKVIYEGGACWKIAEYNILGKGDPQ